MKKVISARYNQRNCLKNNIVTKLVRDGQEMMIIMEPLTDEADEFFAKLSTNPEYKLGDSISNAQLGKDSLKIILSNEEKEVDEVICIAEDSLVNIATSLGYFKDSKEKCFEKYEKIYVELNEYLNAHAHVELEHKRLEERCSELENSINEYKDIISNNNNYIKELEFKIAEMEKSKSWVLTKPIRTGLDKLGHSNMKKD